MQEEPLEPLADAIAALPRPVVLALDVDGTLAPIRDDPARVTVPPERVEQLRRLARVDGFIVALVTGRDGARLEPLIALPEAWRAVEHGRIVVAPGEPLCEREPDREGQHRLARFAAWCGGSAAARGARIERKPAAIAVHVRELAVREPGRAAAILREARERAEREGLTVREGRAVVEAEVEPADKGRALARILARSGAVSTVYAGDDLTDEPAIALASRCGIGIFVRSPERPSPPPGAKATIDGVESVGRLLAVLEARLGAHG